MLFFLDVADEFAGVPGQTLAAAVGDLIRAHRFGYHLAVISRRSASWLANNVDLSERDASMLSRIAQDYTQTGDLRRRAKVYVRIVADPQSNLMVNQNAISVSIDKLVQYRVLDRPILVTENLESDGTLYRFLLTTHCDLHEAGHVSFDLHHGGGADLPTVFEHLVGELRIVGAIIDSDKNAPSSGNRKLAHLIAIKETANWPLCFASSPPCREAENLVPMALTMSLPSGIKNSTNAILLQIDKTEREQGHGGAERYWFYFDLKEGLVAGKFEQMNVGDQAWIRTKLSMAGVDPSLRSVTGYGDNVIRQIFAENKFASELRNLTRRNTWRVVFSTFLDEMVWVFAAGTRVIT